MSLYSDTSFVELQSYIFSNNNKLLRIADKMRRNSPNSNNKELVLEGISDIIKDHDDFSDYAYNIKIADGTLIYDFLNEARNNLISFVRNEQETFYKSKLKEFFCVINIDYPDIRVHYDTYFSDIDVFKIGKSEVESLFEEIYFLFHEFLGVAEDIYDILLPILSSQIQEEDKFLLGRKHTNIMKYEINQFVNTLHSPSKISSEDIQNKNKLKWNCKPAVAGYIISELIRAGYLEPPITNGELSYAKLAGICNHIFDIRSDGKPTTLDYLKKVVNPESNPLPDHKRAKLNLPDLEQLI